MITNYDFGFWSDFDSFWKMETIREPVSNRFARVYGSPGEAPRVLGLLRAFWPLLVLCFVIGYLLRALLPVPELGLSQVGVLLFMVAVAASVGLAWGDRRLGHFLKGAKGEEWVAHELSFLGSDFTVFNGLRLGGKHNLDHVIVGPTGIFVVETKNWKGSVEFQEGKLYVGGHEPSRPPLTQVKAATAELESYLQSAGCGDLPVHSVLCFLETRLSEEIMNVSGVVVCRGKRLVDVLQDTIAEPISESTRQQVVNELRKVIE